MAAPHACKQFTAAPAKLHNTDQLPSYQVHLVMLTFKFVRSLALLCAKQRTLQYKTNLLARFIGSYKKTATIALPKEHILTLKENVFLNKVALNSDEWIAVRQELIQNYKHITESNIDAVILGLCTEGEQLPLAKSYVSYLQSLGREPNAATLGKLLRIYNAAYHKQLSLDEQAQEEVLAIYRTLRAKHDVFDATTCENLIYGLVATKHWEEGADLLKMSKLTSVPSLGAYTELAVKAFTMSNMTLGWQLLHDMVDNNKQPKCSIYIAYLNEIYKDSHSFISNLEKLLRFLENNELIVTQQVAEYIENLCKLQPLNLSVSATSLSKMGKCQNCGKTMQRITTSAADFERLSNAFLNKVLIRQDVFQKSTPEEIEKFKEFVAKSAPYDCVIDGLNVAYSAGLKRSPAALSNTLAAVVRHFSAKKKKVLVLGRKHMSKWPQDTMNFIYKNAKVFLTNNLSHDDPFLLYATLKSGQSTYFFSRDLMRSHAHLLGPDLKRIFRHWQQEHQYSLITQTADGKVLVKEPVRHLMCAHKVLNTWHVPYREAYLANPPDTFEIPQNWICIKIRK